KLVGTGTAASPTDLAWANRTRVALLLVTGRREHANRALQLVDENLKSDPNNVEDLRLRANLLGLRLGRRGEAIKILEPLSAENLLPGNDEFLLAQLCLSEDREDRYQGVMLKILDRKEK